MTAPHSASGRGRPRRVTLALLHRAPSGGVSAAAYQGAVPVSRPFRRGTKAERRRSDDAGVGLLAASGCSHPPDARAIRSRLEFRQLFCGAAEIEIGKRSDFGVSLGTTKTTKSHRAPRPSQLGPRSDAAVAW